MSLKITNPIVSVDWLASNLDNKNIIILDCTIPKVTAKTSAAIINDKKQIKGTVFFDIKKTFSDVNGLFPNTILSPEKIEEKAQELGINKESILICYDDLGIYSAPRAWWMFQLMGFTNIAVLDGGFPKWEEKKYPVKKQQNNLLLRGNFKVNYQPEKVKFTVDVLSAIENESILITDARSKGRFYGTEPEPRSDVKSGHIPNSISLPFNQLIEKGMFKSKEDLKTIFDKINPEENAFIFSCGTGITASVLALGAELSGIKNYAVYDGSWTEWGSTANLPIDKI